MSTSPAEVVESFAELHLGAKLLSTLAELGYEEPTPIQQAAIPPLLEGRDLMGQAATGTGKTAAFALPILQRMDEHASQDEKNPFALVLVPTRELAIQVSQAVHRYGTHLGARVTPIYGGQPIGQQLKVLARGVDVVVATPGRALDHISRKTLRLSALKMVVLDEADEMLDMGFAEDIEAILRDTPEGRQIALFSATLPPRVDKIARRYMNNAVQIRLSAKVSVESNRERVRESAYIVARAHKAAALGRILDVESPKAAVIFCRTRAEVDQLTEALNGRGYSAEALHGGMDQQQRDRVMGRFRNETTDLLVATDVAARGLDVDHLTHVVNFDVPSAPDTYVHRIGRVGRAGRTGVAITLAEPREHRMLQSIERTTKREIVVEKLPSISDLRTRKFELTRNALYECLLSGDFDQYRVIVETLTDEFDIFDVATAAVKLTYEASGAAHEEEIPQPEVRKQPRHAHDARTPDGGRSGAKGASRPTKKDRFDKKDQPSRSRGEEQRSTAKMTRLYVAVGRNDGVRPKDLVGAFAGESMLHGTDIGAIEIADQFSLVEVPTERVDEVIGALRKTTIKGRKANVRRERKQR